MQLATRLATRRGRVEALLELLLAQATGAGADDALYARLRRELLTDPAVGPRIPRYVRMALDLGQFWEWVRDQRPSYAGRRELIWTDFGPILDHVARLDAAPAAAGTVPLAAPAMLDAAAARAEWLRALGRRGSDPAGAVVAACTLLERACKQVLDRCRIDHPVGADLTTLYGLAAAALELAPSRHAADGVGRLFESCYTVVDGLAAERSRLGDATRQRWGPARPAAPFAELAVNLAGSVALLLVDTLEARGDAA